MPTESDAFLPSEETDWIHAAQAGDRQAYGQLVALYWERLYRWLYQLTRDRHQAEDLTQETFLKALSGVNSFRPGSNFRAWLFRIGHNNFVNLKRSSKRLTSQLPEETASPTQVNVEDVAANKEAMAVVSAAVANLPADFKAALLLRVDEGLSFRDVAKVLGITEETARWRVFKARHKLMDEIDPDLLPPGISEG